MIEFVSIDDVKTIAAVVDIMIVELCDQRDQISLDPSYNNELEQTERPIDGGGRALLENIIAQIDEKTAIRARLENVISTGQALTKEQLAAKVCVSRGDLSDRQIMDSSFCMLSVHKTYVEFIGPALRQAPEAPQTTAISRPSPAPTPVPSPAAAALIKKHADAAIKRSLEIEAQARAEADIRSGGGDPYHSGRTGGYDSGNTYEISGGSTGGSGGGGSVKVGPLEGGTPIKHVKQK